ncbi:membrane protein [Kocuria dechangensis]|uniref:Membrane protein n=1 Tax=Kocuria dechangensis TaxID=1176249 RepID=A0A917M324_9MICC|nr:anthrone oxygenase family protein [Kocuria dechangensis]GGG71872.1 membrane protein [Kocuria dechangensis]
MSGWLPVAAGVGSGMVGGFYLAFSAVVIPALHRRPAEQATAVMVAVNEAAVRAPFMILFFGTAAACAATAVVEIAGAPAPSLLRIAAATASLAGWVSTMAVNVPLNRRLATGGAEQWPGYHRSWSRANHLRAGLSVLGAVALLVPA